MSDGRRLEARLLATKLARTIYVNVYKFEGTEIQMCEVHRGNHCCGAAHPDGIYEIIVQSPSPFMGQPWSADETLSQ